MNYVDILPLSAPVGDAVSAGIVDVSGSEVRFDLLDAAGNRLNGSGVMVAARSVPIPPQSTTPWSDLRALMLADIEAAIAPAPEPDPEQ